MLERPTPVASARPARALRRALPDSRAGPGAVRAAVDRAAAARLDRARLCARGSAALGALRGGRTRRAARARSDGRARPLAADAARRVPRRHRPGLLGSEIVRYLLWHVAELDLYVGVIRSPALLALWIARGLPRRPRASSPRPRCRCSRFCSSKSRRSPRRHSFRIEERNIFYRRAARADRALRSRRRRRDPARRRAIVPAALIAGALPGAIPFGKFVNTSVVSDTLGLLPWWWLQDHGIHVRPAATRRAGVGPRRGAGVRDAAAALRHRPCRRDRAVYFVLTALVAENGRHGIHQASLGGLWAGIRVAHSDWIDRRVGRSANVAFLWHSRVRHARSGRTSSSTAASGPSTRSTDPIRPTADFPRRRFANWRTAPSPPRPAKRRASEYAVSYDRHLGEAACARSGDRAGLVPRQRPAGHPHPRAGPLRERRWSGRRRHLPAPAVHRRHPLGAARHRRAPVHGRPACHGTRERPCGRTCADRAGTAADASRAAASETPSARAP